MIYPLDGPNKCLKKKNKEYYFNSITGESTWKKPTGGKKKTKRNLLKIKNKTMRK